MAIDEGRASRPLSLPLSKNSSGALDGMMRRNTDDASKEFDGPHWRPSMNRLLRVTAADESNVHREQHSKRGKVRSRYLDLPQELLDMIESHLSSADLLCLRQTCISQRHGESTSYASPAFDRQFTMSLQVHSLRARLDRDYYHTLCRYEDHLTPIVKHAACSFCYTLHPTWYFSDAQLARPPATRRCTFALRNYLVCGNYWLNPSDLRDILETLTQNDSGFDRARLHTAPAHPGFKHSHLGGNVPIATMVENTPHISSDRSVFTTSVQGLKLIHHFHLQSLPVSPLRSPIYGFAAALESPRRSVLAICPHLTVNSAGFRLGLMQDVGRGLIGQCPEEACGTVFGWFECKSETPGWRDLCFRVERRFGWLESLGDGFWRSQTVT